MLLLFFIQNGSILRNPPRFYPKSKPFLQIIRHFFKTQLLFIYSKNTSFIQTFTHLSSITVVHFFKIYVIYSKHNCCSFLQKTRHFFHFFSILAQHAAARNHARTTVFIYRCRAQVLTALLFNAAAAARCRAHLYTHYCSSPHHLPPQLPHLPPDSPPDLPPELPPDSPPDLPPELPPDSPPESPPDLPPDLPPELPPDSPPDLPPESPPDLPPDLPPELPPDSPHENRQSTLHDCFHC
jgi:hypothetical protein